MHAQLAAAQGRAPNGTSTPGVSASSTSTAGSAATGQATPGAPASATASATNDSSSSAAGSSTGGAQTTMYPTAVRFLSTTELKFRWTIVLQAWVSSVDCHVLCVSNLKDGIFSSRKKTGFFPQEKKTDPPNPPNIPRNRFKELTSTILILCQ